MRFLQAFETMMIRDALKHGCYELQKARDAWRVSVGPDGMDADLVQQYIEVCFSFTQSKLLARSWMCICCHSGNYFPLLT